ncbi:hypothetical protein SBV1_3160014 [Verrucomicrobia bacterium]|nr:hypothetical protein SBV1_3160014 [Verrucomicrobiota bacterium]
MQQCSRQIKMGMGDDNIRGNKIIRREEFTTETRRARRGGGGDLNLQLSTFNGRDERQTNDGQTNGNLERGNDKIMRDKIIGP